MSRKQNNKTKHHSLSLTINDDDANRWLDEQKNISASMRLLILSAIRTVGYTDYITALASQSPLITKEPPKKSDTNNTNKDVVEQEHEDEPETTTTDPVTTNKSEIKFMGLDKNNLEQ